MKTKNKSGPGDKRTWSPNKRMQRKGRKRKTGYVWFLRGQVSWFAPSSLMMWLSKERDKSILLYKISKACVSHSITRIEVVSLWIWEATKKNIAEKKGRCLMWRLIDDFEMIDTSIQLCYSSHLPYNTFYLFIQHVFFRVIAFDINGQKII